MQFRARLAKVGGSWSATQGVKTTLQVSIEGEEIPGDWLMENLGEELFVELSHAPPPMTPMEAAIELSTNGHASEDAPVRERRGRSQRSS
jgi:hypothetical protein